jgi:hypothetical protein
MARRVVERDFAQYLLRKQVQRKNIDNLGNRSHHDVSPSVEMAHDVEAEKDFAKSHSLKKAA